jgi:hypothetical protein
VRCETSTKHDTKCRTLNFKERGRNSWSCDNLVGVLSYGADQPRFESPQGQLVFFSKSSRLFLGPTHPFIQCVWGGGVVTPGEIQPGRKADHSPPSRVNIKNEWRLSPQGDVHLSEINTTMLRMVQSVQILIALQWDNWEFFLLWSIILESVLNECDFLILILTTFLPPGCIWFRVFYSVTLAWMTEEMNAWKFPLEIPKEDVYLKDWR